MKCPDSEGCTSRHSNSVAAPKQKDASGRRNFLKSATLAAGAAALAPTPARAADSADRHQILSALGDTIVPSKPGDPGFKDLEPYGITKEVNKSLSPLKDQDFVAFNDAAVPLFQGRTFVDLGEEERSRFLTMLVGGEGFPAGMARQPLQRFYRLVRLSVLRVFYSNFPENKIARDSDGVPLLAPGDTHQVPAPNTKKLVTGWDIANYRGPLTWEQEDEMRRRTQQIHWHDDLESLIVRYRPKSS